MMALAEPIARELDHAYNAPKDTKQVLLVARDGAQVANLYAAGDLKLLARPCVAVVGSREASTEGRRTAWQLASELVAQGVVVVSGLAAGIDAAAHRGAMETGGHTIAVIGTPLDRVYPKRHARLQESIHEQHLLLSPFAPGTGTTRGHFPARNRVMARIADATVVVEAGEKSGTVHQVNESLAIGRPVLVAECLLRGRGVTWVRDIVGNRGVIIWATSRDVIELLALARTGALSGRLGANRRPGEERRCVGSDG
jgi:DNA processing protein